RLLREAAADLRRPWEKPAEPGRLTPARVRRGFRNLRPHLTCPARAPKPTTPGSGRPIGSKNRRPATRYNVGKTVRRPETIAEHDRSDHKAQAQSLFLNQLASREGVTR
ncbi:hypothetical protein ABTZ95_36255, partial [Streptomyces sp. NPDC094022]